MNLSGFILQLQNSDRKTFPPQYYKWHSSGFSWHFCFSCVLHQNHKSTSNSTPHVKAGFGSFPTAAEVLLHASASRPTEKQGLGLGLLQAANGRRALDSSTAYVAVQRSWHLLTTIAGGLFHQILSHGHTDTIQPEKNTGNPLWKCGKIFKISCKSLKYSAEQCVYYGTNFYHFL